MAVKKTSARLPKPICTRCGQEKGASKDFYISKSDMYRFYDGRMPICKSCLNEMFEKLELKYDDNIKALYHLCMNLDMYFGKELALSSCANGNLLGEYIKSINSLPQYRGKSSFDSDYIMMDESLLNTDKDCKIEEDMYEEAEMTPQLKRVCLKRWGNGYSDEDYLYLEETYAEFYDSYSHETPAERMLLMNISKTLLEGDKCRRSGDKKGYENMLKLVSSMLTDANIKPSQKKSMGDEVGECFGVFIENLEKNEPVNEAIEEFADADNIGKLIDRQFVRNFAKVFGLVGDDDENED